MIDPGILQQIANTGQAYPGAPNNPAGTGAGQEGEPSKAEPVALHEMCETAREAVDMARQALESLAGSAQMAENVDPKVEKAITQAAMTLGEVCDSMDEIGEQLGEARQAHEDMVSGKSDSKAPGGRQPPPLK